MFTLKKEVNGRRMVLPLLSGNGGGNFSAESPVVHEEELDVSFVADNHLFEA